MQSLLPVHSNILGMHFCLLPDWHGRKNTITHHRHICMTIVHFGMQLHMYVYMYVFLPLLSFWYIETQKSLFRKSTKVLYIPGVLHHVYISTVPQEYCAGGIVLVYARAVSAHFHYAYVHGYNSVFTCTLCICVSGYYICVLSSSAVTFDIG